MGLNKTVYYDGTTLGHRMVELLCTTCRYCFALGRKQGMLPITIQALSG